MPRADASRSRCAIYTRKSSEEGLEQEFNSLAAQREACEAYIRSQQHEGWLLARNRYDDGGFSGGNLERPAAQRLLTDIRAGRIDIVATAHRLRPNRVRTQLSAGGKWIRTIGPWHERAGFCRGRRIAGLNGVAKKGCFVCGTDGSKSISLHRRVSCELAPRGFGVERAIGRSIGRVYDATRPGSVLPARVRGVNVGVRKILNGME